MIEIRMEVHNSVTVWGKKTWISGQDNSLFGRFWEGCHADGTVNILKAAAKPKVTKAPIIGVSCVEKDPKNRAFDFYVAPGYGGTAMKVILINGSPVYFASPNGSLLALLDRLYAAYGNSLMYKPWGCIVSARRAGTTSALEVLNKYPLVNEQPLVSSSYWCMVHGSTPEEVRSDAEGMEIAYNLGRNMAWMVKALQNAPPPACSE